MRRSSYGQTARDRIVAYGVRERSASALSHLTGVIFTTQWKDFERAAPSVGAGLIVCPRQVSPTGTFLSCVRRFVGLHPSTQVIIVAPYDAEVALRLPATVDHVVWEHEISNGLQEAIDRIARPRLGSFLPRLPTTLADCRFPLPAVVRTLVYADPPITRVSALARTLGMSTSFLYAAWSRTQCPCSVKRLIDTVALTHALQLGLDGFSRLRAARAAGMSDSALRAMSLRVTGRSFSRNLDDRNLEKTIERLRREIESIRQTSTATMAS